MGIFKLNKKTHENLNSTEEIFLSAPAPLAVNAVQATGNDAGVSLAALTNPIVVENVDGLMKFDSTEDQADMSDTYYDVLHLEGDGTDRVWWARVTLNCRKLPTIREDQKVYLKLTTTDDAKGVFIFAHNSYNAYPNQTYYFDITNLLTNYSAYLEIYIADRFACPSITFHVDGEFQPQIILFSTEEETYNLDYPNLKELPLGDFSTGYLDLNKGTICTAFKTFDSDDFALPLNISHIYKATDLTFNYGKNWRLNLERSLKVADDDTDKTTTFVYTDELGNERNITEKYYYFDNGFKYFVSKNEVTVDLNGNLSYYSNPVYKLQSCDGYVLISEINDFKGSNLIEQRQEELIKVQDALKQYKNALRDYVCVNTENGDIILTNKEATKTGYENLIAKLNENGNYRIMTESQAVQLKMQLRIAKNNHGDIDDLEDKIANGNYNDTTRLLMIHKKAELEEEFNALYQGQIDLVIRQAEETLPQVKEAFETYFNKLTEEEYLLRHTPVNYLKDDDGVLSGFNKDGRLVCLCDKFGNYVAIEYDSYGYLRNIFDSNGKSMAFEYGDDFLSSITDNIGRKVIFGYSDYLLTSVTFPDGQSLQFTYKAGDVLGGIISNGYKKAEINYSLFKVSGVSLLAKPVTVSKTVIGEDKDFTEYISTVKINYNSADTEIVYYGGESEIYRFSSDKKITSHTQRSSTNSEKTVTVTQTEKRSKKTVIYKTSVDGQLKETLTEIYDMTDWLLSKETDWQPVSANLKVKTTVNYSYDNDGKITSEKTVKQYDENGEITARTFIVNYSYNAQGQLTLKESYTEGEELTAGKSYVRTFYDDYGNITKTASWNSLDSSSKFYSESVYSDNGRLVSEKDETGEAVTEYDYIDGTKIVNSVKDHSGGTLAYGKDPYNFNVTSVTKSTEDGEANGTDIIYNYGLPVEIKSGNTGIGYEYDCRGRKTVVSFNGAKKIKYDYTDYSDNDDGTVDFGSQSIALRGGTMYTFKKEGFGETDEESGLIKLKETVTANQRNISKPITEKNYDIKGRLISEDNYLLNPPVEVTLSKDDYPEAENPEQEEPLMYYTSYLYDDYDNLICVSSKTSNPELIRITPVMEKYGYDAYGAVTERMITTAFQQIYEYSYNNNSARDLQSISVNGATFKPLKDVNGRNTGKEISVSAKKVAGEYISYRKFGDHATVTPSSVWFASGKDIKDNLHYSYDKNGNIIQIKENGKLAVSYEYDSLNRLVKEDNKLLDKLTEVVYDNNGNILYKHITHNGFTSTDTYLYDGDKLMSFNGETFKYNNLGSPTVYRGKTLKWLYDKLLIEYDGNKYIYNGHGQRVFKNDDLQIYDLKGNIIGTFVADESSSLQFIYDDKGVAGVVQGDSKYFFRKDIQGNIIALLDETGEVVVRYVYDAWGNHAVLDNDGNDIDNPIHIGNLNPFRYRGYFYDIETGLYFLQTRYYDPETGRFISQDSVDYADPETINGINLYAYCGNNPVMNVDPSGHSLIAFLLILAGVLVSGVVSGISAGANASEGESFWSAFLGGFVNGVISGIGLAVGLAFGGVLGGIITIGAGFLGGFFGSITTQAISYGNIDLKVAGIAGIIGAGTNLMLFTGMNMAGIYSNAGKFIERFLQNLSFGIIPLSLSIFIGSLPMFNPNIFRKKR